MAKHNVCFKIIFPPKTKEIWRVHDPLRTEYFRTLSASKQELYKPLSSQDERVYIGIIWICRSLYPKHSRFEGFDPCPKPRLHWGPSGMPCGGAAVLCTVCAKEVELNLAALQVLGILAYWMIIDRRRLQVPGNTWQLTACALASWWPTWGFLSLTASYVEFWIRLRRAEPEGQASSDIPGDAGEADRQGLTKTGSSGKGHFRWHTLSISLYRFGIIVIILQVLDLFIYLSIYLSIYIIIYILYLSIYLDDDDDDDDDHDLQVSMIPSFEHWAWASGLGGMIPAQPHWWRSCRWENWARKSG